MGNTKLRLNDTINDGKNKAVPISELVNKKGKIFEYIKKGVIFDDEVLAKAGIKKGIRNMSVKSVIAEHKQGHEKKLPRETESLKNILKSLNTIDTAADNEENDLNKYSSSETED